MKKILPTLAVAFTLMRSTAVAQCPASFTWNQSQPNLIDFTNTSSPQNPGLTTYMWDFGDQQYDWQMNPSHTYNVPGTYWVCLTLMDSVNQITCTYCDSVNVTGSVLCNLWAYPQVTANATCQSCADGSATVTPYGGTAPYSYTWSSGGNSQSVSGLAPGVYTVCVTDVNSCVACDSVVVGISNSTSCAISFVSNTSSNWSFFQSTVTGSNASYVTWDFGDQSTGVGNYAWHQYAANGVYSVCATLIDSTTMCSAMYCDSVVISNSTQTCDANFYVWLDSTNNNTAWVYNLSYGSGISYQWYWGDNSPVDTATYPTHVYQSTGSYNICLVVVSQSTQCTDTLCQLLWVPRLSQAAASAPFYVNVIPPQITGITAPANEESWSLYPNPTNEALHVNGTTPAGSTYLVTDVTGRTVLSGTMNGNSIDVAQLGSGVYFFTLIKEKDAAETKRFIRE